jgi:hypothetical protein
LFVNETEFKLSRSVLGRKWCNTFARHIFVFEEQVTQNRFQSVEEFANSKNENVLYGIPDLQWTLF